MNYVKSIRSEFDELHMKRETMLSRFERLAQLTVPSVLTDEFYDEEQDQLTNSWSSLGAQAVTHLTNKLMLTMFAPSNPFIRLELDEAVKAEFMKELRITEDVITDVLSAGERAALKEMERIGLRPQLFEAILHLIVIGNVLMDLSGKDLVLFGVRDYVVQRSKTGRFIKLIIKEDTTVGELSKRAQAEYRGKYAMAKEDQCVAFYRRIKFMDGKYYEDAAIDDFKLSPAFNARYSVDDCPYHALTWRLPAKRHYGVGRVEDYAKDFGTHDMQSQAMTEGAVLASQFRWAVNPAGTTRAEDIIGSANGAAVPASENDIAIIFANIGQQLNTVLTISQEVSRRIGHGFLVGSAVTRDAERVTVEEIRMQAQELESSLGGVYTRLSLDIQLPLAKWLLKRAKVEIEGTQIDPIILTGLDALSRSADLDRLTGFIGDVTTFASIPPDVRVQLNENNVIADMAAGRGVARARYVASPDEVQARQAELQTQQTQQVAAEAGAEAGAQAAVQPQTTE
jgi:hypothetical protein